MADNVNVDLQGAFMATRMLLETVLFNSSGEESTDEEEEAQVLRVMIENTTRLNRREPARLENFVENVIPNLTHEEFQQNFRLTRTTYQWLLQNITNLMAKVYGVGRERIPVEKQILAALWILATPDSYRSVGMMFNLGKSSLWSCFYRLICALNQIAPQIIKWPSRREIEGIKESFMAYSGIRGVIGAIDGSYVPIKAPKENPEAYYNRKFFYGITLQAVATPNLKFTDIFTGYPSSVHDARIFRNSDIFRTTMQNRVAYFNQNEFILGDTAYPLLPWCITPYINNGNLNAMETNFNTAHARTRQVIERTFCLLFERFRRLRFLDMQRLDLIPSTIVAACVLHNICLLHEGDLVDLYIQEGHNFINNNGLQRDEDPLPEGEERNVNINDGQNLRNTLARNLYRRNNP